MIEETTSQKAPIIEPEEPEPLENQSESDKTVFFYILGGALVLVLLIITVIYLVESRTEEEINLDDLVITQPFVENNEFRSFLLPNGVKVLLVKSNDGMENSFVSLSVGVGSQTDPLEFSGFTHLIEHLLFTGSKNFPEDNYIEKVVNKYNGENNGVTKSFTTSYYYKVGPGGMEEFAEVLADAVANPLFDETRIAKEINNVNSEISMRMTFNKNLGYYKMLKEIGNPNARVFRDGFKNIDAESLDLAKLREEIIAFHKRYYSAGIMSLAVITDQELGYMETLVKKHFSHIHNTNLERPTYEDEEPYEPPFLDDSMGNVFYVQGFSAPSKFYMIFQVPAERKNYKFHPLEYFSFFLNYHSENSLKDRLISKNLITDFDDELTLQDYKMGIYLLDFELTEYGESHISDLIVEFFNYVEFLRELDVTEELFQEVSTFSKFSFLFNINSEFGLFDQVEQDNFERVLNFSESLLERPAEFIFTSNVVWQEFNPFDFKEVLDCFKPKKTVFMIESLKFKTSDAADLKSWEPNDINGVKDSQEHAVEDTKEGVSEGAAEARELKEKSPVEGIRFLKPRSESQVVERFNRKLKETKALGDKIRGLTEILLKKKVQESEKLRKAVHSLRERVLKTTFYDSFFNDSIRDTRLQYAMDFDNNRQFHYEKVPFELWSEFKEHIRQSDRSFDRITYFGFRQVENFNLISECKVPPELADSKHLKTKEIENNHLLSDRNVIDFNELNEILFREDHRQQAKIQKMLVIRALLIYKICLINEFDGDDQEIFPKEIFSSSRMKVFHKLYRKTLQPKFSVKIMVENPYLNEGLIKGTAVDKQLAYIKASLFCLYVKNYLSIRFRKEFTKGNDFSMGTNGYAISLVFMGISSALPEFMNLILESLEVLGKPELYDEVILETIRQQIANNYSSFDTTTSLHLSTFYLDLMVDQLEIDFRTEQKQEMLRRWIYSVTSVDLAHFFQTLQNGNKLTMLFTGNVDENSALKLSENIKKNLLKDLTEEEARREQEAKSSKETITTILDNILMRFNNKVVHYMVRKPDLDMEDNNNVYLTYFRANKISVRVNIISTIIGFWLKNYVFDKLRNQMNLGYVAHASTREYYYRTGIIILVQGENFRPAEIEKVIEDTVLEFIEQLRAKTDEELDDIKMLVVEKYTEFSNSLSDVTSKEWNFIEAEYILGERADYEKEALDVSKDEIIQFAEQMFIHRQKRITVELFAHGLTEDEHRFQLLEQDSLGGLQYEIRSLDEIVKIRDNSVEYFERKLQIN